MCNAANSEDVGVMLKVQVDGGYDSEILNKGDAAI